MPKKAKSKVSPTADTHTPAPKTKPVRKQKVKDVNPNADMLSRVSKIENTMPPTAGPLTLTSSKGRVYTSSKATIIACLSEISTMVQEDEGIFGMFDAKQSDSREFLERYTINRRMSTKNSDMLMHKMDSGKFVSKWPNYAFDTTGTPINGGHTGFAHVRSKCETLRIGYVLGVDPRMRVAADTGKLRDLVDQLYYLPEMVTLNIEHKDRRQYASAVGTVYWLMNKYHVWGLDEVTGNIKKQLCMDTDGVTLLRKCNPYFVQCLKLIAENKVQLEGYGKVTFYVPALLLGLNGHAAMIEKIAIGENMSRGDLLFKCCDVLSKHVAKASTKLPIRNQQSQVMADILDILAFPYAVVTGKPYLEPLRKTVFSRKGENEPLVASEAAWKALTTEKRAEVESHKRNIERFFVENIKR